LDPLLFFCKLFVNLFLDIGESYCFVGGLLGKSCWFGSSESWYFVGCKELLLILELFGKFSFVSELIKAFGGSGCCSPSTIVL